MKILLLALVVLSVFVIEASAFCMFYPQSTNAPNCLRDNSTVVANGRTHLSQTPDCMKCFCRNGNLRCCSYGWKTGTRGGNPPGCQVDTSAPCTTWRYVRTNNTQLPCAV